MKKIVIGVLMGLLYSIPSHSQGTGTLSLQRAVELALAHNPQIHIARNRIDVQRGGFWRAIAPPSPTASVNYAFVPVGQSLDRFSERTIEFSQTLEFPTTTWLRGSQASSEISAAEAAYASAAGEVTAQVKIAYAGVLAKQQKLALAEENLAIADDVATKSSVRKNVGEGTQLEQLTASVQRMQAFNGVEAAKNDLRIAVNDLVLLLGVDRSSVAEGLTLADTIIFKANTCELDQLVQLASQGNAQLKESIIRQDIASKGYSLAWSGILPSISASYFRQTRDGVSGLYGASFGMSIPLWFLFDQRGHIESAQAASVIADHERRQTENTVNAAVKTLYYEMANDERQVRSYQTDILPQSAEILRSSKASYDAGEISYLEYLQARQLAIQAKAGYIDAMFAYNTSMAKLEQVIGKSLND